jgi:nucleoside-diphosphate-sugar epimerase
MTATSPDRGSNTDRPLYVVLGATGGVGRAVLAEAAARGHRVRAVSRSATAAGELPAGVDPMDADLRTPEGAAAAVDGADVVVHAAQPPYTRWPAEFPALTRRIADAAATAGAKLVMADNLYMYGPQPGGRPMTEDTAYAATDSKGRVRAAMATELLDRHARGELRVALGRASDYYGPHGTVSALGEGFFGAAVRGRTVNAVGSVQTPHSMAYLPDFAAGLLTLAERDTADGRAWHLPVAEPLTTRAFADLLAAEIERPVRLRAVGARTLRLLGLAVPMMRELAGVAYQWEHPFVADDSAFRAAFPDAVSVTPHPSAIATTVGWYRLRVGSPART